MKFEQRALVIFAVVEFVVIAFVIFHMMQTGK